jgi:hypothetical protein
MKALTIWRPWTHAICHPGPKAKRVENRCWSPPRWLIGQTIAIHAGRRYDNAEACRFIAAILGAPPPGPADCPEGIVALAVVVGARTHDGDRPAADNPWLVGPVGWLLDQVRALPRPVACPGAQGVWLVPADVEAAVQRQIWGGRRGEVTASAEERAIGIVGKFYDARSSLRFLWAEEYEAQIAGWRTVVRACVARERCDLVEVPLRLRDDKGRRPDGHQMLAVLAAVVEECEGEDATESGARR